MNVSGSTVWRDISPQRHRAGAEKNNTLLCARFASSVSAAVNLLAFPYTHMKFALVEAHRLLSTAFFKGSSLFRAASASGSGCGGASVRARNANASLARGRMVMPT